MDNPLYDTDIIVGGSATQYTADKILGERIHAGQSFDLQYTFKKSDETTAFSVAGASATLKVSAYKGSGYIPVLLVSGVPSDSGHGGGFNDRFTFTVPENAIPSDIATFPLRTPGNAIFYAVITDGAGKKIEVVAEVNIYDDDYSLTGEAQPSERVIIPKGNDLGTVESLVLSTPPTPTLNVAYIVGPSGTGDWLGQDNNLAIGTGTAWVFLTPVEGNFVYDKNTDIQYVFDTSWVALDTAPFTDANALVKNDADNTKLLKLSAANITAATTRTATFPDADGTVMYNLVEDLTPQLGGTLETNSKQVRLSKGADVASAAALPVLTDGNYFDVTGTTTITSINTLGVGTVIRLHFDGILTLTHNATDLVLPGAANITTAAGDVATFVEIATGDYECTVYTRASGSPIVGGVGVFRDIYIDAAAMVPRTTNGANPATKEFATNDIMIDYLEYDSTTEEGAQFKMMIPDEWDLSTIKFKFYWDAAATASGTVVWGIRAGALSNDDAIDAALGTEVTVTDTLLAVGDMHVSPATAAVTVGGTPALEDMIIFQIVAKTSGTIAVDQFLMGVSIQFKELTTPPVIW